MNRSRCSLSSRISGSFALLLSLVALAGPGQGSGLVYLNEIVVQGPERVELYNPATTDLDVSGWTIRGTGGTYTIPEGTIVPGRGYRDLFVPGDILSILGGETAIADLGGDAQDLVVYGQLGGAPLPPSGEGVSLCRAPDGSENPPFYDDPGYSNARNWTLDLNSTFGFRNDAPEPNLGRDIRINEVFPARGNNWVEFFNPLVGRTDIDLTGWFLVDGLNIAYLAGTVPGGGVLALSLPTQIDSTQLVYLFDDHGVRVDQIGLHGGMARRELCAARCPNGSGPADGYDYLSSGGDVSLFVTECTLGELNPENCQIATRRVSWGAIRSLFR